MLAYYGTSITGHIIEKPDGGIICTHVPIARTGEMQYLAGDLELDGDPGRPVTVVREPEDVFEPAALASFEGAHVTDNHPPENVTAETFGAYSRGHVQNIRREGDYVVGDLHIGDKALASEVLHNVKRQISCGYECVYEPLPDGRYRQTRIRGNHVAVVPTGRAGPSVSIHDSAENAGKGKSTMSKFAEAMLKAFGMAAKEAKDDREMDDLVSTAMTALDAAPAETEPSAPEAEPASDTPAPDPAVAALGAKLDKLLEILTAKSGEPEGGALDEAIRDLADKDADGEGKDPEVIPAEGGAPASGPARDAALALLRTMRPAVASIEDAAARKRVTDALLDAVKTPGALAGIMQAAQQNARKASDAAPASFEKLCADQKAAYDARNPHKQKEDK
ncbi:MAG: DUF2213 domain-containing protein [Oscillospiraceae bacterium]|nr:DUF2213 domain-containing protein [Oscillospiraceae bacterium]